MKTRKPKADPEPRKINFDVQPGIFTATGAEADPKKMLDVNFRMSKLREAKARKAARADELIIAEFKPGMSGRALRDLVNAKFKGQAFSERAFYDALKRLRAAGKLPPKSKKDSHSIRR
jgi:hypothetical protein